MRTIRNRKNISKSIVRKINNFFDSVLYRNKWGVVTVLNTGEIINTEEYLRLYSRVTNVIYAREKADGFKELYMGVFLQDTNHPMLAKVSLFPLVKAPVVIERNNKRYYGMRFEGWESEFSFSRLEKGDTVYVHYCPDKPLKWEILQCMGCRCPIVGDEYIETEDTHRIYCGNCQGDYYYECDSCGEYFDEEYYEAYNDSNMHICHHCFEWDTDEPDGWYRCNECGEVFYDCGTWVHDRYGDEVIVCESCEEDYYRYCEDCEEYHHRDNMRYVGSRGGYVCDECIDDHYIECAECNELYHENSDLIHYDDREEAYFCENCRDNRGCNEWNDNFTGRVIRRYHDERGDDDEDTSAVGTYDMDFLVETTRQDDPTIGTELEADEGGKNDDNAEEILEILGDENCIASEDASIEHGFEIVSRPAQLCCHKSIIEWERALDRLRELGYKSHDCGTCGIHTHIDRDFFEGETKDDVDSKFIITLQNNFWWLRKFSRRDDTNGRWQYCALNTNNYLNDNDKLDKESVKNKEFIEQNKSPRWCHRLSVNVDHTNTVEIRLYRGTLVYNTFIATLECSDLWARLVKGKTIEESTEIELKDFISLAEKMEYTEFLTYLNKRNIHVSEEPQRRLVRYINTEDYHYVNF